MRGQIKLPQRYVSDDFVAYAFIVTNTNEEIIVMKIPTYVTT